MQNQSNSLITFDTQLKTALDLFYMILISIDSDSGWLQKISEQWCVENLKFYKERKDDQWLLPPKIYQV